MENLYQNPYLNFIAQKDYASLLKYMQFQRLDEFKKYFIDNKHILYDFFDDYDHAKDNSNPAKTPLLWFLKCIPLLDKDNIWN